MVLLTVPADYGKIILKELCYYWNNPILNYSKKISYLAIKEGGGKIVNDSG